MHDNGESMPQSPPDNNNKKKNHKQENVPSCTTSVEDFTTLISTPIPPMPKKKKINQNKLPLNNGDSSCVPTESFDSRSATSSVDDDDPSGPQQQPQQQHHHHGGVQHQAPMTREQVGKEESKVRKILLRIILGACMFAVFSGSVYLGHLYICVLVALIELLLFRELVRVRYSAFYHKIHDTIPLFRTTQWMWFALAIFYTYGDFASDTIQSNKELHHLIHYAQFLPSISFILYSVTFVLTIATLQRDHIKFQINQLCWTILVLCLTVGQLKYIMHNVYNGLIWFVLPSCLVFVNDIMAYVSGMTCGRKFIHRPFISFSPNKTWEGFIGGAFFTMITAWYLSRFLARYTWMACPTNEFRLFPNVLSCELDPIFLQAQLKIPPQAFELLPRSVVKVLFPHIVEMCAVRAADGEVVASPSSSSAVLVTMPERIAPCLSGDQRQVHHHFELTLRDYYPIQMHALWMALFASFVAPFGGFLASAIKRAYGVKDFDSLIPGHGGVMDRMDCQFLMALCTWVHYNTFVKLATVSVPKMTYMYSLLTEQEKAQFLESITVPTNAKRMDLADYAFG